MLIQDIIKNNILVFNTGKMIKLSTGSNVFFYKGYTFCRGKAIQAGTARRWICSQHKTCKVYVHLDNATHKIIVKPKPHNHSPPRLNMLSGGTYYRVITRTPYP